MVGDAEQSLLIQAVAHSHDSLKMPPNKQLAPEEVEILRQWIAAGVAWPQEQLTDDSSNRLVDYDALRAEHWAWQPLEPSVPPQLSEDACRGNRTAYFLLVYYLLCGVFSLIRPAKQAICSFRNVD